MQLAVQRRLAQLHVQHVKVRRHYAQPVAHRAVGAHVSIHRDAVRRVGAEIA